MEMSSRREKKNYNPQMEMLDILISLFFVCFCLFYVFEFDVFVILDGVDVGRKKKRSSMKRERMDLENT